MVAVGSSIQNPPAVLREAGGSTVLPKQGGRETLPSPGQGAHIPAVVLRFWPELLAKNAFQEGSSQGTAGPQRIGMSVTGFRST